jgi:hypothetical protein
MKTKKTQSIIFQILIILSINYLILIAEGFIFKTQWKPNFIFALVFFHFGTFSSLYATFISKILLKEKEEFIFNFNMFFYISFVGLLFYHNCQIQTDTLMVNYIVGLFMLFMSIIFLFETVDSYKKYNSSLIINTKN